MTDLIINVDLEGVKEVSELVKAGKLMIADLKEDKDTGIKKIGTSLENALKNAGVLAERESVQNFAKELEDVLKLPHTNKRPLAVLLAAMILRP
jgi:hypothetical protein